MIVCHPVLCLVRAWLSVVRSEMSSGPAGPGHTLDPGAAASHFLCSLISSHHLSQCLLRHPSHALVHSVSHYLISHLLIQCDSVSHFSSFKSIQYVSVSHMSHLCLSFEQTKWASLTSQLPGIDLNTLCCHYVRCHVISDCHDMSSCHTLVIVSSLISHGPTQEYNVNKSGTFSLQIEYTNKSF